jgi:type I restriction enzyme S subunit
VTLGEIVDFIDGDRGKNYPSQGEFFPAGHCLFLSTKNVPNSCFNFGEKQFIDEEKDLILRQGKLKRGDYVLTTRGTVGNFAYYDDSVSFENVRINSGMVILRKKSADLNQDYLRYFLASSLFSGQVKSRVSGSAQPQLPIRDMLSMKINLPDLPTQSRIASVLSTYDDLIENNEKRVKILEEMAQRLYTEWFVKFKFPGHEKIRMVPVETGFEPVSKKNDLIPDRWEVKKLGDIMELAYGKALKSEKRSGGNIPVYGSSGHVGMHNEKFVSGPGIVIGRKGNVGDVYWVDNDFYPIDTTFYVKTSLDLYYVYFVVKSQKFISGDAAVPGLNRSQAYRLKIIVPEKVPLNLFSKKIASWFNEIRILRVQIKKLHTIRDLLIPQLVTGKKELR